MTQLRPYQAAAIDALRAAMLRGARRILLVLPTAGGKGTLLCKIIETTVARGRRALFIVAGRQLVDEFSQRLTTQFALDHGVVMAGHPRARPLLPVQVASVDTLASMLRRGRPLPAADLVIVDEADLVRSARFEDVLAQYPSAHIIGDTATPIRADGKGLGKAFDVMIEAATTRDLIRQGFLSDYDCFGFEPIDAAGLKITAGDFDTGAQDLVLQGKAGEKLAGDIVEKWHTYSAGRRSLLFAVTRRHSRVLVERLNAERHHGAPICVAEHVDGESTLEERAALHARLLAGDVQIVSNVGIVTRGVDWPCIETCIFACRTKSLSKFLQCAGRAFRLSPQTGKNKALFLDHADLLRTHGLPDEVRPWTLGAGLERAARGESGVEPVSQCKACFAMFRAGTEVCPLCGKPVAAQQRPPPKEEHKVRVVTREEYEARATPEEKLRDARALEFQVRKAIEHGWNIRSAGHRFVGADDRRPFPSDETLRRIENELRKRGVRQGVAA